MANEQLKRRPGRPRKNPIPEQQVDAAVRNVDTSESRAEGIDTPAALKVHIYPSFGKEDQGDGGIRRVVEAQLRHLPKFGIEIVGNPADADVIACHAIIPSTYIKLYPDKPFVSICHGMYWSEYEWQNWSLKANGEVMEALRVADAITTCSEWVANSIRRHTSRPVSVIGHGIDIEDWDNQEEPHDYVLWNKTRVDPVCDPEPLNEVARILPKTKFISTYGNRVPNVALTGRLEFSEAKKLIQKAGVYLCTSRETFGVGTLEALACGVPVVGFNYGGQAEFIEHGKDGWLVTPGDFKALAEGIQWAFDNRDRISENCKAKAAIFTWERSAKQYADLFRKVYEEKQKKSPRTTIIVTNYNLEKYLNDCLTSVKRQTDKDWECIIIDDASPNRDGVTIAKEFTASDPRFKLIQNEKNVYLAEARNIGIRQAQGRYILPLDADDMLDPEAVKILADALDEDRTIHVAYGNVLFMEEDGRTKSKYGEHWGEGHSGWPMAFVHEQQILQRNLLPYCSMYRKEAWLHTGGYRRRCRTAEDADFWTRLSSYGFRPKMVSNADTLVYRNREGSMSRTNSADWVRWFTWHKEPAITPAGAVTKAQLPIPSLDPVVISVIIPVGPGHEKIVTDAVDSVDAQTFRLWECIVVNDTGQPLETEFPAWVRVIDTGGRTGVAHARNVGIAASKGWLFLPLDADDYLEPDALKIMHQVYRESKDLVYSDFWQTSPDGKNVSIHHCDDYDPTLISGKKRTVNGQVREGMMHSVTVLTPKAVWQDVGGYDETLPAWEDWDFQLSVGDKGYCSRRVAAPLFVYRKHTGFRREENYDSFAASKEGIINKWGHLWNGGKELMACGTCGSRRSVTQYQTAWGQKPAASPMKAPNNDAVLIRYTGNRLGATPFRGPSKTVYWFGEGDVKYVLAQDVQLFMNLSDFVIVKNDNQQVTEPVGDEPILMA